MKCTKSNLKESSMIGLLPRPMKYRFSTLSIVSLLGIALLFSACAGGSSDTANTKASPTPRPMEAATATPAPTATPEQVAGELKTLPNGLQYQDLVVGTGPRPLFGQKIRLLYVGRTTDGVEFDSTKKKPPLDMVLGKDPMIKGWEIGVGGGKGIEPMRVGGKRKLIIPPALGYGNNAMGTIPPNSTLVFEIELAMVK
jgi:FKBP-type peptidyl-prolyl cis-trans isomerase